MALLLLGWLPGVTAGPSGPEPGALMGTVVPCSKGTAGTLLVLVAVLGGLLLAAIPLKSGGAASTMAKQAASRVKCRTILALGLLAFILVSMAQPGSAVPTPDGLTGAEVVDFLSPQMQAKSRADLEEMRAKPHDPRALAKRLSSGINAYLPHGVSPDVPSDRYWIDEDHSKLVFDRVPGVSDADFMRLVLQVRALAPDCVAYSMDQIEGYQGLEPPMTIETGDVQRIFQGPRRNYSQAEMQISDEKVDELEGAGIATHLRHSNFACNPVLAAKRAPDGTWSDKRFCINYIPINKHTELDTYGCHRADDLFQKVTKAKYLTALDLRSGFHQIPMHPDHICKTAFWHVSARNQPPRLMAYQRMPFGLKNASAKFQRVMDAELQRAGCTEFAFAYIDDLIIASNSWDEHVEHVRRVLSMLADCRLRIHPSKSVFATNVVEYLGHHVVAGEGVTMSTAKVAAIKALPVPRSVPDLRSILGFMAYYRHFIPSYSSIAEPLNNLLRKDRAWHWGECEQNAYDTLKELMTEPGRVLRSVDPTRPLILHTDWSIYGIGAVLGQKDDDGNEYLCACISRSLNKHERRYAPYKGELLALAWAVGTFRRFIHGVHFHLVTDHQALTWLMKSRDLNGQYARWQMQLQEHDFDITHRPGARNQNADVLSRFPQASSQDWSGARLDFEPSEPPPSESLVAVVNKFAAKGQKKGSTIDDFCPKASDLLGRCVHWDVHHYADAAMKGKEEEEEPGDPDDDWTIPAAYAVNAIKDVAVGAKAELRQAVQEACQQVAGAPTPVGNQLDRSVVAHSFFSKAPEGIALVELCGGVCSGLETVLTAGIPVTRYLYADIDPVARQVAEFRAANLAARYPALFSPAAWAGMFELSQDIRDITLQQLVAAIGTQPRSVLVTAGWPCQDFSPAGRGVLGSRAALLDDVLRLVSGLQRLRPVAYLLENVPLQLNFRHKHIRRHAAAEVEAKLGKPVVFDAIRAGSYARRLRNYWTNLAPQPMHQAVCDALCHKHGGDLYDILRPGRLPMPPRPGEPEQGHVRRYWPTLMSYRQSRAFRPEQPGAVLDAKTQEWLEPMAVERELAMGYEASSTACPGVTDGQRCALLGQAIDVNALFAIFTAAMSLQQLSLVPKTLQQSESSAACLCKCMPAQHYQRLAPVIAPTDAALHRDVWSDGAVIKYLRDGEVDDALRVRVLRTAQGYKWFNNRLYRQVKNWDGQEGYRMVPEPPQRESIILNLHEGLGHIGEKRTIDAVSAAYWWQGLTIDVKRVLSGCKRCKQSQASGGQQTREMQTEPADLNGMFHRWGLDYLQDLPASASGNRHALICIDYYSKWIEALPCKSLDAATTTALFHTNVVARFGPPAEVVSDNGPPFIGGFEDFCKQRLVKHRFITAGVPRSNGQVERAVQIVKKALRKQAAAKHNALTWDTEALPDLLLGYRCTTHAATGHSPARILYALDPVLDGEQYLAKLGPINYDDAAAGVKQLAEELLRRARLAKELGLQVTHNIRAAHERDARRFKALRSGLYVPRVEHFQVGDFVFVLSPKEKKPGGALGMRARNELLKIVEVRPSGVLRLVNQAGRQFDKHMEDCALATLPNIIGDTYAGLVKPPADLPCKVCGDPRHWESMLRQLRHWVAHLLSYTPIGGRARRQLAVPALR